MKRAKMRPGHRAARGDPVALRDHVIFAHMPVGHRRVERLKRVNQRFRPD